MTIPIGSLVATGRTSNVYAFGAGSVVKVPKPQVPASWAVMEARFTEAVRTRGVAAPAVRDIVTIDGRDAIVFERINGRSMWQLMLDRASAVESMVRELGEIHRSILSAGLPAGIDGMIDRIADKIAAVDLSEHERGEALGLAGALPRGAALLHGDLHPGNILMSNTGPVVIDWFDAAIGHPVGDVVRSSLLVRPFGDRGRPPHLPGASPALLRRVHECYVMAMADVLAVREPDLRRWEAVVAVSRLAEGAQPDESSLVALWNGRSGLGLSPLVDTLAAAGLLGPWV